MPKPRVYVETTIPNFYYDLRSSAVVVEQRAATRKWWLNAADRYQLVTGPPVLEELAAGTSRQVAWRLKLLEAIPVLALELAVAEIVQVYLKNKLMPAKPTGDALHLALASHHGCDFIVTWNCRHLANPNKFVHIQRINRGLGLSTPQIVTPLELKEEA